MHPSLRHALALTAIQCLALSPSTAAEYEFFETLPLVLSGSRLPQSLPDAPGAITVIDADMITATGYLDLARVLRLVPGFQVAQERGGRQWVTYHGLGMDVPQQMQVIIDGRPSPSAHFNQLPERILLQDIERIEVLRGSNSAAYGSNAFHGAVNISTRHSASESGSAVRFLTGSEGINGLSARHTAGSGLHSLRITAAHEKDDGFNGLRDGTRTNALSIRSDLQLNAHDEVTLSANIGESVLEEGYAGSIFNNAKEREARNYGQAMMLRWRHATSTDNEWLLTASWDRQKVKDEWQIDTTINVPPALVGVVPALTAAAGNDLSIEYYTLELQQQSRVNSESRLVWGTELRHARNASEYYFNAEHEVSRMERRAFANLEWRSAPAWLWNFAGMVEQVQGDSARFAPRAFLNWQLIRTEPGVLAIRAPGANPLCSNVKSTSESWISPETCCSGARCRRRTCGHNASTRPSWAIWESVPTARRRLMYAFSMNAFRISSFVIRSREICLQQASCRMCCARACAVRAGRTIPARCA